MAISYISNRHSRLWSEAATTGRLPQTVTLLEQLRQRRNTARHAAEQILIRIITEQAVERALIGAVAL